MIKSDLNYLINEFNFFPLRYIHPSWLKTIPDGKYLEDMRSCARTEYRLSHYLISYFGLENEYCFDFNDQVKNLALLDKSSLYKVISYAGLAINRDQIKKNISRDDVTQLKQKIGDEEYVFALKRAPFLGAIPEFPSTYSSSQILTKITISGVQCLATLFSDSTAVFKRLFIKLPFSWKPYALLPANIAGKEYNTVYSLLGKIQAELEII